MARTILFGFNPDTNDPLDSRLIVNTIAERDAINSQVIYEGMVVYVRATKLNYTLTDTTLLTWTVYEGPVGPQGIQGEQGIQGNPGVQGIRGNKGAKGDTGEKGDNGNDGSQGIQGIQGPIGIQGAKGDTGVGTQGPIGLTGPSGNDGATGSTGSTGQRGVAGTDGAQGVQGIPGTPGQDGAAGIDGSNGSQGIPGNDGLPGAPGAQGNQGDTGPAGQDGAMGPEGDQGPLGPRGPQGQEGRVSLEYFSSLVDAPPLQLNYTFVLTTEDDGNLPGLYQGQITANSEPDVEWVLVADTAMVAPPVINFAGAIVGTAIREGNEQGTVTFTDLTITGNSGFTFVVESVEFNTPNGWSITHTPGSVNFTATTPTNFFGTNTVTAQLTWTKTSDSTTGSRTVTRTLETFHPYYTQVVTSVPTAFSRGTNSNAELASPMEFTGISTGSSDAWFILTINNSYSITPTFLAGPFRLIPESFSGTGDLSEWTAYNFNFDSTEALSFTISK